MKQHSVYDGPIKNYGFIPKTRDLLAGWWQARRPLAPDAKLSDIPFYRKLIAGEHWRFASFLRRWRTAYDALIKSSNSCQEEIDKNARVCSVGEDRAEHFEHRKDQAATAYKADQDKLHRTVERWQSQWKYWMLLSVIGFLDSPVNFLALQFGFSDYPVVSAMIAVIFGVIIAASAHGIGQSAKRFLIAFHEVEASNRSVYARYLAATAYAVQFTVLTTVMGLAFTRLGRLRQEFLTSLASDNLLNHDSLFTQQAVHTLIFGQSHVALNDQGWTLIFINTALLALGAAASYSNCDSDKQFERSLLSADAEQRLWEKEATKLHGALDVRTHLLAQKRLLNADLRFAHAQPQIERTSRAKHVSMQLGYFLRGYEMRGLEGPTCLRNLNLAEIEEDIAKHEDVDAVLPEFATNDDEEKSQ